MCIIGDCFVIFRRLEEAGTNKKLEMGMKTIVIICLMLLLLPAMTFAGEDKCADSNTDVSGFVDASYWGNLDEQGHEFALDQAEIDVERSMDDVGIVLRVDFEWVNDGAGGFNEGLEQGYMNYTLPFMPSMNFTFGKFNAPIGFERLDPIDMYQYSHSLVFDNCLPTNLTGAMGNM
ncbi:MAG TPA: hypothetical protein ENH10_08690, partial [Bacteroidetes bacterium]|nr:hypothetical protein [Bacteroidota bacterium]HEX05212.1 hypothetical protein [Bacteroidota bacterium]